jgi:cold shock CspA family protein
MRGTIKTVKSEKGYGFVMDDDNREFFFHRSEFHGHWNDLVNDFADGHKIYVRFEEDRPGDRGPRAKNVVRLDHPNQA